jgi:phosphoribosylglycinamide formyltransferase-1
MTKIALFVSGSGSLIQSFLDSDLEVGVVVYDRDCLAYEVAKNLGIKTKKSAKADTVLLEYLDEQKIEHICLAGYLKIIDKEFIDFFKGEIINTHPSLLPRHGGFYGDKVHQAVIEAEDNKSGFTVHVVTPELDAGPIIEQVECDVLPEDSVESLRARVQNLEKEWYPKIVSKYLHGK